MITSIEQDLLRFTLFRSLTSQALAALAGITESCTFSKDEVILEEGTESNAFYALVSGRVKMCRLLPTGQNLILALFQAGDVFGTVAALGAQPCTASMIVMEDCAALRVVRDRLFGLFAQHTDLITEVLPVLTRELVECKNCIVEVSCLKVDVRFSQLLLRLADSVGRPVPTGVLIPMRLSRQELADMTGTTIETCIRLMSRWNKAGIVLTRRDGFVIQDAERLEELALG